MVGRLVLAQVIGVRIPVPEQIQNTPLYGCVFDFVFKGQDLNRKGVGKT